MTNALRPSELFAFRWKRFEYKASTLTVAETVYKGKIRDWGKTKKSLTVTIKDVQGVMRHSRTATTTDVYMQEIPASVQSTINSINLELRKSDARSRKNLKESASTAALLRSRRKPSERVTQNDTKSPRGGSERLPAYA
ncbi:site-specific integrase [Tunturiibacter lichenicola]|uniref:hypothetical protein n=1 Tax=Tunturiibacter lichenicola TaxID=2051959 RepID=UPI0021B32705|nr:hypothetical protein [Edaphobacter lichenicola]